MGRGTQVAEGLVGGGWLVLPKQHSWAWRTPGKQGQEKTLRRGVGLGGRQQGLGSDPKQKGVLGRRARLWGRAAAHHWIFLSILLSLDSLGVGEMQAAAEPRSNPTAELLLPGSTLAQIRSPG